MDANKRIILAVGGASGAVYARWVLLKAAESGCDIDLVISPRAGEIIKAELKIASLQPAAIAGVPVKNITVHDADNMAAPIASGSVHTDAMIICPCSSNTLAAIASGQSGNLMHRAAYVCLKERWRLILVHRETPLTAIDIDNMARVTAAGGIIYPASPVFYTHPQTIDDLASNLAVRVLTLAGIEINNPDKWQGK